MKELTIEATPENVDRVIEFIDDGIPYDPLAKEDPDISLSTGNGLGGFEFFNMPSTRSLGFNVKLTF